MFKKLVYVEAVIVLGLIILGVYFIAPLFADSRFVVVNHSLAEVNVVAYWKDQKFKIGIVEPSARYEFTVGDEAAMRFSARNKNGKLIESQPIYFTSGTSILVNITESGIEVAYDFST